MRGAQPARRLEFWPDYGGALLHEDGRPVLLATLGLPADLVWRAEAWVRGYDDARLEPETRDEAWIAEGQALFRVLRAALDAAGIGLVDWETTWTAGEGNGHASG